MPDDCGAQAPGMPKAKKARHAYYAVARGRNGSAVYKTWAETEDATRGVSHVRFRGCSSPADVRAFFAERGIDMEEVVWGPGTRLAADAPVTLAVPPVLTATAPSPPPLAASSLHHDAALVDGLFALLLRVGDQMDRALAALGGRNGDAGAPADAVDILEDARAEIDDGIREIRNYVRPVPFSPVQLPS